MNSINLNAHGGIHVPDQGAIINDTHRRVDELLRGYDPYLELHFIPPESRGPLDVKPWAVVHRPPGGQAYYVFYADDADERLLARVIRADNARQNVLTEMEAMNLAREALDMKAAQESRMEAHEFAAGVFRSKKYHFKHNGVDFGESR